MSVDVIETRTKKARKALRCDYCGKTIEKGEEYSYQKNIFGGTFYVYERHTHLACSRVASAIWDYVDSDEGMSDQAFQDECREICRGYICPDCSDWNYESCDFSLDETYCIDKIDEFFKTHELYKAAETSLFEFWHVREKEEDANE